MYSMRSVILSQWSLRIDRIEAIQRRALRIIYSYTNDTPALCIVLPFQASPTDENSSHASFKNLYWNPHLAFLASYLIHATPQLQLD